LLAALHIGLLRRIQRLGVLLQALPATLLQSREAAIGGPACQSVPPAANDLRSEFSELSGAELGENVGAQLSLGVAPGLGADLEMLDVIGDGLRDRVVALISRLERLIP